MGENIDGYNIFNYFSLITGTDKYTTVYSKISYKKKINTGVVLFISPQRKKMNLRNA